MGDSLLVAYQQLMDGGHTHTHFLYENGVLLDIAGNRVRPVFENVNNIVGLNFGLHLPLLLGAPDATILILVTSTINICWHRTNAANLFIIDAYYYLTHNIEFN